MGFLGKCRENPPYGILEGEGETRSSIEPARRPFPTRQFIILARKDEPNSGLPVATLPAYDSSRAHSWSSRQIHGAGLTGWGRATVPIEQAGGRSTLRPKEDHR